MGERRRSIRKPVYIEDLPRHIMYESSSVKFNANATTKRFDVICCWAGKEGKERKESLRFKNSTFTSAFIETSNGERMNEWTHRRMNGQMARTLSFIHSSPLVVINNGQVKLLSTIYSHPSPTPPFWATGRAINISYHWTMEERL